MELKLNGAHEKSQKRIFKRCVKCRKTYKIHRAAKVCPDCLAKTGVRHELESFSGGE
jgi:ssDNA-binding Zn-finger/Zn-ribbon topoisomerase 1